MNESDDMQPSPIAALDWRALAEDRLQRLVEMEHDHALIRDRLELVQVDFREVLLANAEQLQRILALDRDHKRLQCTLTDIESSYSWRLMWPVRAIATWLSFGRRRIGMLARAFAAWLGCGRRRVGMLARALLRTPVLRRCARVLVRWMPGLGGYLRRKLHAEAGTPGRGSRP